MLTATFVFIVYLFIHHHHRHRRRHHRRRHHDEADDDDIYDLHLSQNTIKMHVVVILSPSV